MAIPVFLTRVLLLLSIVCSGCALMTPGDVGQAKHFFQIGKEKKAIAILESLSSKGYRDAKITLASYLAEQETENDLLRARDLFSDIAGLSANERRRHVKVLIKLARIDNKYIKEAEYLVLKNLPEYETSLIEIVKLRSLIDPSQSIDPLVLVHLDNPKLSPSTKIRLVETMSDPKKGMPWLEKSCEETKISVDINYCWRIKAKVFSLHDREKIPKLVESVINAHKSNILTDDTVKKIASVLMSRSFGGPALSQTFNLVTKTNTLDDEIYLKLARHEIVRKRNFDLSDLESRLKEISDNGMLQANTIHAKLHLYGKRVPQNPWEALKLLNKAENIPEAQYLKADLLASGKLGYLDIDTAKKLLLDSGRGGYLKSYSMLMDLYSGFPSVRINDRYAHVFAGVLKQYQYPLSIKQKEYIAGKSLSYSEKQIVDGMVAKELGAITYKPDLKSVVTAKIEGE